MLERDFRRTRRAVALRARRLVRLDSQHVVENASFLRAELSLVAAGIQHDAALIWGNGAQILEGAAHLRLPIHRQRGPLAGRAVDAHAILRRKMFDVLGACQAALPLLFRQLVHTMELLREPLLVAGRQATEAGIAVQHPLLVLHGNIAMLIEPCAEMARRRIVRRWISAITRTLTGVSRARIARSLIAGSLISRPLIAG